LLGNSRSVKHSQFDIDIKLFGWQVCCMCSVARHKDSSNCWWNYCQNTRS